jgi:hypothetical protein
MSEWNAPRLAVFGEYDWSEPEESRRKTRQRPSFPNTVCAIRVMLGWYVA